MAVSSARCSSVLPALVTVTREQATKFAYIYITLQTMCCEGQLTLRNARKARVRKLLVQSRVCFYRALRKFRF